MEIFQLREETNYLVEVRHCGRHNLKLLLRKVLHLRYDCSFIHKSNSLFCCSTLLVAASILPLKNLTVVKGTTVNLLCDVSGRPEPSVSWTQVSTGKKQFNKTWILTDFRQSDIGEYRCDASNAYGKDSQSTFIDLQGKCRSVETTLKAYGETSK